MPQRDPVAGPSTPSRHLLTEEQLAARWALSVKTLQAARLKGSLVDFVKIGRSVRYRLTDVEAYENAQLRRSTSDPGSP